MVPGLCRALQASKRAVGGNEVARWVRLGLGRDVISGHGEGLAAHVRLPLRVEMRGRRGNKAGAGCAPPSLHLSGFARRPRAQLCETSRLPYFFRAGAGAELGHAQGSRAPQSPVGVAVYRHAAASSGRRSRSRSRGRGT